MSYLFFQGSNTLANVNWQFEPVNPLSPAQVRIPLISVTVSTPLEKTDQDIRQKLWYLMFGNTPMPQVEDNAVEKYAGFLDKYLPSGTEVMDDQMRVLFRAMKDKD